MQTVKESIVPISHTWMGGHPQNAHKYPAAKPGACVPEEHHLPLCLATLTLYASKPFLHANPPNPS